MNAIIYKVNLYGPFYSITRTKSVELTFEEDSPSVKRMLQKIVERYPQLNEHIFEDGHLAENTTIVINGDLVCDNELEELRLAPTDKISLFKGQHGG